MTGEAATVASALREARRRLSEAGVAEAPREARLLVGHALGAAPEALIAEPQRRLLGAEARRLDALVGRRRRREPISRLLGRREFWSLAFRVTADTLDPRPDSETVIEAALAMIADRTAALTILDLGTGTGCLLAALLSELPNARGLGVDISAPALTVARSNLARLGLAGRARFQQSDWGASLTDAFDVIVANPPYVRRGEIAALAPEISRFEPAIALDGGVDGLDAYRSLAPRLVRLLAPNGFAAVEIGQGQGSEIKRIFSSVGIEIRHSRNDLGGVARCLIAARLAELTVT